MNAKKWFYFCEKFTRIFAYRSWNFSNKNAEFTKPEPQQQQQQQ